ncbi:hypothetical protein CSUI_006448 [Cystoisospora suis]|uniref:Uncharacterized protein n=1 Tax=Cystoisospora suis TaxID=483139 RepID=A0A2C6KTX8_9APIC|nr:hypothetical protein CSUI_006448 [Cystoisospora suis]
MLNISDMCEGHGWRVLEELRRLLVLRQGRVSLPWDREEESCRVCLAHLALLKRTFENTVFDDVREDCLMAPPHASSHFQLEESSLLSSSSAGHLLSSPSARSQTLGDLPVGDPGGGIRREDSPLKKKVSFSLHASLRAPADATEKREVSYYGQSNLRRQNAVRHQWMKDLRKSLELSTAYATKGRKQPAVFLRIAALKPLLVYRHLNSAEVKMILVEVFQRLWMKFVEYSLARQVRVSTAALVLDCSFLTEYDCSSGAFHFLMKDLRDVVRAFCPLVIRRVIFFNYTQAHERIWLILRSAVENACFFSFYDDDRDLATEIEGERPFIYHTMLLNKRDLSLLTQVLPPLYVGLGGDSNHNRRRQSSASKACLSSSSSSFSYLDDLLPLRYFRVSPKIPEALFGEKEEEGLLREAYSSSSSGVVPSCSVDFLENQLRVFRLLAGTLVVLASADLEPEMPGRDIFKEAVRTPEQVASSLAARIRGKEEEEETKTDDFSVVLRLGEKLARLLTYKEAACFWKGLNDLRDIFVEKKRERRRQRRQAQGKDEEEEEDDEDDDEEEDDGGLIDPEGHLGPSEEALREAAQRAKEKKWREEDPTFQVDEEKRRRRTCEIFDAIFAKQDEVKAELEETSFEELFEKSVADAVNDKLRGEGLRVPSSSRYLQSWSPSGETGGEVTGATSDLSLLGRRLFPVPLDLVCRSRISPQVDQIYAEGFPEDDLPKLFSVPQASSTSKYLTMRTRG